MTANLPSFPVFTTRESPSQYTPLLNVSNEIFVIETRSTLERWLVGMIVGSAPFLLVLACWMFVSLGINNLVRFYQRIRKRYRHVTKMNGDTSDVQMTTV